MTTTNDPSNTLPVEVGALDAHAKATLLRPDAQLDAALANARARGLHAIEVSPLQGQFLANQCRLMGAKSVLEVGALGGYSAICFARAGARVTSIEIDPKHRDIAQQNTKGLDVDVILGGALDVLPRLAQEGRKFDLVFLDASWEEQAEYFEWAVKLTRPNGCIFVDNAARAMMANRQVGREDSLFARVGRDKRVSATFVPIIAGYRQPGDQYDGFLHAVVLDSP